MVAERWIIFIDEIITSIEHPHLQTEFSEERLEFLNGDALSDRCFGLADDFQNLLSGQSVALLLRLRKQGIAVAVHEGVDPALVFQAVLFSQWLP